MCDDCDQHETRCQIKDDTPMTPRGTKFKMSRQSSFKLFSSQQRSRLTALYPFLTAEQINRKVLTMWSKLSMAEKKNFGSGNISSSCLTPKRISRISVLCTPRLTSKRLKTDNMRYKAQLESSNRTFDFDFLSPEMPVKPLLHLGKDLRQTVPKDAGARREESKPKVLTTDYNTSDISMVCTSQGAGKMKTTTSGTRVQRGRTKLHTHPRPSPKPCALIKEGDPSKLDKPQENASGTPQDNTSSIHKDKSSSYDDFESIDKENLIVETEDHLPPFRPKWGEPTYTGWSFSFVNKYAAPEVIDDTPSEKPGILRKSAEKPKQRRVSFSEREIQSVITFQQESSQERIDPVEVIHTVGSAENDEEDVVEVVGAMAKVTDAVYGSSRVGGENEMMKRAAFYAGLMVDVSENCFNSTQDENVSCLIKEQKTGVRVAELGAVITTLSYMDARASDLVADSRDLKPEVHEFDTEKHQDTESSEIEREHADKIGNNLRLNDEAKLQSWSETGTACLVGQREESQHELKEDAENKMNPETGMGSDVNEKALQREKGCETGKLQQGCSELDKNTENRMENGTEMESEQTIKKIGERKKRRAVGCRQTIDTGIEEIGGDGSVENKQREGTQDVGYGRRKRPRRESAGCPFNDRPRTRSYKKNERQEVLVLSTNDVVTVAEVHADLGRNNCEGNHFDVDHESIGNNGGGGDADQSIDRREKKAYDISGEVSKFPIGAEETSDQHIPKRSRERRRLQQNVSQQQEEKTSIKSKFIGPENLCLTVENKCHKIGSVSDEIEGPRTKDQISSQNVSPPIASDQGLCLHGELKTPLMGRTPFDVETVELVTPMTNTGLIAEIDNQVQLAPRKGRSDQNEHNLRTPKMGITALTPMTDVQLIQEIKNKVKFAPQKSGGDPNADLMTPLMGTTLVHSSELELVIPMTDVRLIEKIQNQVQLAPKKNKNCPDCQEDENGDHQIVESGEENLETDSTNASRKLWNETRHGTEGNEKHAKPTHTQSEGKGQSLKTPESECCLPDARMVKDLTGRAQPSSWEQSQESNQSLLTLPSVDSFCLDPCDIFNSSPPDHQEIAMTVKQSTDFSVAQAVRNMQMIGCVSLISPVSSILSASLSGVSQLSSTSSVTSCDGDVVDNEEDTATLPKLNDEDIKDVLIDFDDESQEQTSPVDSQQSLSVMEQSGCSGVRRGAIQNPSKRGNNQPDGDLCDMFQNMTPPKSVKKSGRRLIASNQREGDNQVCNLFEDDDIFL